MTKYNNPEDHRIGDAGEEDVEGHRSFLVGDAGEEDDSEGHRSFLVGDAGEENT